MSPDRLSEGQARQPCAAALRQANPTLSAEDADRYRRIFEAQQSGDMHAADREVARLRDKRLLGHVLHDRYISSKDYRASFAELRAWLDLYADQPGADEIYALALKRKKRKDSAPRLPIFASGFGTSGTYDGVDVDGVAPGGSASDPKAASLFASVSAALKADGADKALAVIEAARRKGPIGQTDDDRLKTLIAAHFFYAGEDKRAFDLAAAVSARSGDEIPRADWIAGIAAWRLGRLDHAVYHFETLALSGRTSSWTASAAAYWAARVHLRNRSPQQVTAWLQQAGRFPYTFYGMVARRTLGLDLEFQWEMPKLTDEHFQAIAKYPAGYRALGLIAAGQRERAKRELIRIHPQGDAVLTQGLLALAEEGGLPALSMKIARAFRDQDGGLFDAGLYPIPPWRPRGGFAVDRALVYAVMRQESLFNPRARSTAGATGLMQLMPDTAAEMSAKRGAGDPRKRLLDPNVNVDLGQRYLSTLLGDPELGGNLFLLITAYNGGPANAARWRRSINDGGDPLLFIESIPYGETRAFIERVMANYWMYRTRLGLKTGSLTAIASGEWPLYDYEDPMLQIAEYESTR